MELNDIFERILAFSSIVFGNFFVDAVGTAVG